MTIFPLRLRTLLILLSALGLLPLALVGAWGIHTAMEQQRRELERAMLDVSRALASAVDAELEGTIGTLRTMARDPALARGDLESFYYTSREAVRVQPDWASVILTDAKGRMLFKTSAPFGAPDNRIIDPASLAFAISTGSAVVGKIALGPAGKPAFPVRVPVTIDTRRPYVLTAAIRPDRMLRLIQRQNVPHSWVISVQEGTGLRVARTKDHHATVGTGASPTLAALVATGNSEGLGITRTLEDVEVVTAFTRVPRYGWYVAIGAPTTELQQTVVRSFALYGAAIALSLGLCIGLAVYISRRTALAVETLAEQAARLGRGQPVTALPSEIVEVGQMGLALEHAARERAAAEREREALLASLNAALEQAESAGRAKDHFLAVLGHELRNPLAPIVTSLDLMDLKPSDHYVRERAVMRRQVVHLKRLIDDLLDVSRISQGKLTLQLAPLAMRTVVEQAVEAVQTEAQAMGVRIATAFEGDATVAGDESRLIQVVTNLLGNAVRHSAAGTVSVSVKAAAGKVHLSVSDTGAGMSEETLARIFDAFYQAPQPLARSTGGLGLGLAIVRSIVELHGGSVTAASAGPGSGSTFTVTLPAL
ncbi:MAG TPA: sensor histidine kinase [Burkholderiaceae bacterium]